MFPMVYDTMRQFLKALYPRRASLLLISAPSAASQAKEVILNVHDTIVELDLFIGGIFHVFCCIIQRSALRSVQTTNVSFGFMSPPTHNAHPQKQCLSLSLPLTPRISFSFSLSFYIYISLSLSLILSHTLSLPPSPPPSLTLCLEHRKMHQLKYKPPTRQE